LGAKRSFYEAGRKLWTVIYDDDDVEDYHADEFLKIILPAALSIFKF
jgi:hypothetical protein